jgi:hypothetical protein
VARKKKAAKKKTSRKGKRKVSAKQRAAARKNIKKAQAARRRKAGKRSAPKATKRKRSTKRKSRKSKGRTARVTRTVTRTVRVPAKKGTVRIELTKPRRKSRRRKNPIGGPSLALARMENPSGGFLGGLLSNPNGPFSRASLGKYATAAVAVTIGFVGADMLDRFVATRAPGKAGDQEGKFAWQGRNAAAAQLRRPDGVRLAFQAGGAVFSMALAYWTRNGRFLPWALGGLSVGFGANLGKMLVNGYLMPVIFKVEDPSKPSLGNRLYPTEQEAVQKALEDGFAKWNTVPTLANQQVTEGGGIASPLGGAGSLLTLGKGDRGAANGQVGAARSLRGDEAFVITGSLGKCGSCGGMNGCYSSCERLTCGPCAGGGSRACKWQVEVGADLDSMLAQSGTDVETLNSLNGGMSPDAYWIPGNYVVLPNSMCKLVAPPESTGEPFIPATSTTTVTEMEGGGGGMPYIPEGGGGGEQPSDFETTTAVTTETQTERPQDRLRSVKVPNGGGYQPSDTEQLLDQAMPGNVSLAGVPPPVQPKPSIAPEARALSIGGTDEDELENY